MFPPNARFQLFVDTVLPRWQRADLAVAVALGIPSGMEEWAEALCDTNGVPPEQLVLDALCTGALCVRAVQMGLHVGITTDGHNFPRDYSPGVDGPMGRHSEPALILPIPCGVADIVQDTHRAPERIAWDGLIVMQAALEHPVPGGRLVIAQLVAEIDRPPFIHRNNFIPVPYSHAYVAPAPA